MGGVLKTQKETYPSPRGRVELQDERMSLCNSGGGLTRRANFDLSPSSTSATQTSLLASVSSPQGRSMVAFTLAEVLITLGIIGVVAALTLPTVIQNYQKVQTISKLKRSYAIINNALDMAKVEYGTDINLWEFSQTTDKKYNANRGR